MSNKSNWRAWLETETGRAWEAQRKAWKQSEEGKAHIRKQAEGWRARAKAKRDAVKEYTCKVCGFTSKAQDFSGNRQWCNACVIESKLKECERCHERKLPEEFKRLCRVCNECREVKDGLKMCGKCHDWKSLDDFYNDKRQPDGKTSWCKACTYKQPAWKGRTKYAEYPPKLLKMAEGKWAGMHDRCNDPERHNANCYRGIEVRVKKDEFIRWIIPELERFYREHPYEVASIDRINPDGHYEWGNMRVISLWRNSWRNRSNPEALLPDGFDDAFIGIAHQGYTSLAAYDYDACLQIIMKECGDEDVEAADEYMQYNVLGTTGEYMPVFVELTQSGG